MKFNVKAESNGIIEYLKHSARKSNEENIYVGIQKKERNKKEKTQKTEELTNAQIGLYNEFGTEKIPPRSFIRSTLIENRRKYRTIRERLIKRVLNGEDKLETVKKKLGQIAADDIKKKITNIIDPPNAPSTVSKKGFNKPLIDTAQMRNSVNYIIAKRKDLE